MNNIVKNIIRKSADVEYKSFFYDNQRFIKYQNKKGILWYSVLNFDMNNFNHMMNNLMKNSIRKLAYTKSIIFHETQPFIKYQLQKRKKVFMIIIIQLN